MAKVINFLIVLVLILVSFILGVKYSNQIKNHASWMFESKDEEVALPDLSNEEMDSVSSEVSESEKEDSSKDAEQENTVPE